ncbi:neuropilin-1-like isoform X2 [Styela clava]
MYKISFFLIVVVNSFNEAQSSMLNADAEARCMSWAMKRLTGAEDVSQSEQNTTNILERLPDEMSEIDNVGPYRPGKRGPPGSSGPQGPPGLPGVCDCIPEEVIILQEENKDLKETFCLLGMKASTIPDSSITVSSNPDQKTYSRLDYPSHGWYPSANNPGHEWIMTDLGKIRPVTGVVTQGRYNSEYWTKQFQVEHSQNGFNFTDVKKSDGSEMVFYGNSDRSTKVVNRFPKPVLTRFVRIYPMAFYNGMYIRFDVIDC